VPYLVVQVEMSTYLKSDLQVKQLVANGNEGHRSRGVFDPIAPLADVRSAPACPVALPCTDAATVAWHTACNPVQLEACCTYASDSHCLFSHGSHSRTRPSAPIKARLLISLRE
jgi:hypothetical protein